jgi:hypothetical protein
MSCLAVSSSVRGIRDDIRTSTNKTKTNKTTHNASKATATEISDSNIP